MTKHDSTEPEPARSGLARKKDTKRRDSGGRAPFDVFERRKRRIEAFEQRLKREGRLSALPKLAFAMCTFDRCTDPTQLRHDGNVESALQIEDLTQYLIHRVKQRAGHGVQRRPFDPPRVPPMGDSTKLREQIVAVEERCRRALLEAFPPQVGSVFPIRRFEQTLAAFVGGEIRTGLLDPVEGTDDLAMHGVPDSANYFCFAEAVLLFLHCRIETKFWTPILRTFVGGAQFFASLYWDRTSRSWGSYSSNNLKLLVPAPVILAVIDHVHAAMDTSQLAAHFTDLVALALRDDPTLPAPQLTAKELQ